MEPHLVKIEENTHDASNSKSVGQALRVLQYPNSPPRARIYAAGKNLRYGVRVVVGYQDWLVFYTVPTELYYQNADEPEPRATGNLQGCKKPNNPIEILGCHMGFVPGLVDVAVDSGPEMAVWAFDSSGEAKLYKLDGTFKSTKDMEVPQRVTVGKGDIVSVGR